MNERIIILDRDGVINVDSDNYIKTPDEWVAIPGSVEAIAKLYQNGYKVFIATNQSGLARGLFSEKTLAAIHQKMFDMLDQSGGKIEKVFYCPHHPDEQCQCRKPNTGLLKQIADYTNHDLQSCAFVGDSIKDIQAAQRFGCTPIFINNGKHDSKELKDYLDKVTMYPSLRKFVEELLL